MDAFAPQQPDEGYSEDPLSGPAVPAFPEKADDAVRAAVLRSRLGDELSPALARQIASLSTAAKKQLTESLLESLPTSVIVDIIEKLSPRLYIDFIRHLPAEICLKIFGYLDPVSLIAVACTSRAWYRLAVDRTLWEALYHLEGFKIVTAELRRWEEKMNRDRPVPLEAAGAHASKRRAISSSRRPDSEDSVMLDADLTTQRAASWRDEAVAADAGVGSSNSLFGDAGSSSSSGSSGKGKERATFSPPSRTASSPASSLLLVPGASPTPAPASSPGSPPTGANRLPRSTLWVRDPLSGQRRINWRHLYAMRRRLEANWEAGRFTNFQFPHPDHMYEAHGECIYTVQFNTDFLVSGSRDRTIRIWNMKTRRLVRRPLMGHRGSVLCLQFDSDPAEDLIVSGSSDASVVLWRFSTGAVLQRITTAHREPVLNVRFNEQILVTCSKDRSIKVFTRQPLQPGDVGYGVPQPPLRQQPVAAQAPTHVVDTSLPVLPPYTLIGNLEGHNAAVNAVQIHGHEIVSASGDRHVKIWDWPTQTCLRTLIGHTKGIACVQYDGRRIVSGSSDNEVKVFDRATSLEIGSLRGHSSLVRTVQAGFGDEPGSSEEYAREAARVNQLYQTARDSGLLGNGRPHARAGAAMAAAAAASVAGAAGSISYTGATLPPGGGGGRYGRIVSGSYDTTVIIWRRDKKGRWNAQHVLRHEDAAEAAAAAAAASRTPADQGAAADAAVPSSSSSSSGGASTAGGGGGGGGSGSGGAAAAVTATGGGSASAGPAAASVLVPPPPPTTTTTTTTPTTATTATTATPLLGQAPPPAVLDMLVLRGVQALQHAMATHPILLAWPGELQAAIDRHPSPFVRSQLRQAVSAALVRAQIQRAAAVLGSGSGSGSGGMVYFSAGPSQAPAAQQSSSSNLAAMSVNALLSQAEGDGPAATGVVSATPVQGAQAAQAAQPAPTAQPAQPGNAAAQAGAAGAGGGAGPAGPAANGHGHGHHGHHHGHGHHGHGHHGHGHHGAPPADAADGAEATPPRVFKLQFDARQIICCSQAPILVGWDFCNGDPELEEAVRFFATVE